MCQEDKVDSKGVVMTDFLSKTQRSALMSSIKGVGNKDTELVFASLLKAARITGWRRHYPISGRPDFVFPKARLAIFIDGCFWHACPRHSRMPQTNREFWTSKFAANTARDRRVTLELRRLGWHVIRVWEHQLKNSPDKILQAVMARISGSPHTSKATRKDESS